MKILKGQSHEIWTGQYFLQKTNPLGPQGWAIALSLFRSSLFRSFQKKRQGGIRYFALLKISEKERFPLSLFSKRAQKSNSLFRSFKKSKSLFRSFQKEQQRANRSFALFKKSERAQKERKSAKRANRSFFNFSLFLKSESLFFRSL